MKFELGFYNRELSYETKIITQKIIMKPNYYPIKN